MKAFSIITIFTTRKESSVLVVEKSDGCVILSYYHQACDLCYCQVSLMISRGCTLQV